MNEELESSLVWKGPFLVSSALFHWNKLTLNIRIYLKKTIFCVGEFETPKPILPYYTFIIGNWSRHCTCIFFICIRGHSITTWVTFYPILTTYPSALDLTIWDRCYISTIVHPSTYHLITWSSVGFLLTTYLPLLVHVVIECPLSCLHCNL